MRALLFFLSIALVVPAAAAYATEAPIEMPFRQEPVLSAGDVLQVAFALAAALAVALALILFLRRWYGSKLGGAPIGRRIQVCEARRITRRTTVAIIAIDGEELLLAEHAGAVTLHQLRSPHNTPVA
ncbi:MAG TPA: flagellar biosynthetic protein FliO [Gammaproteobacteria bacterium]|nr:flagellar biosynthetic protein FliO [Gammaproteobacteria bacterium]